MIDIVAFGEHQQCPSLNCITYSDGTVHLFDLEVNWDAPVTYKILGVTLTNLLGLEKQNKLTWSDCIICDQLKVDEHKLELLCGEGNLGADGFVAVLNSDEKLNWIAFFDCSNPFVKIQFENGLVCATSSLGHVWCFPLNQPDNIIVKPPK